MLQHGERTPPPRPRPVRAGETLTEADMADALKALREWAGLGQVALAGKHENLSKSAISARELGHGLPSSKFLDAFVTSCLRHAGGFTAQEIIDELACWAQERNGLQRQRRNSPSTTPPPPAEPDPPPVQPGERATSTAIDANNLVPAPAPAPDNSSRRGKRRTLWTIGVAVAVVAVAFGVVVVLRPWGPHTASAAVGEPSRNSVVPAQPLVQSPPYAAGQTYSQTVNSSQGARTYSAPRKMMGEGDRIDNYATVEVSCKIVAPSASAPSVGIYWYRIATPPWSDRFYSPTNSFLNDDSVSGAHDRVVDERVPYCPP